ncbi:MAG: hypothetical protein AAFR15_15120, partial [Cyanobacteria bacterium J06627_15]
PWEGGISAYVENRMEVTVNDILEHGLGVPVAQQDKRSEYRITNLLKQWGWTKERKAKNGQKLNWWKNPKF